ncbi:hypothetical protein [Pseudoalteromonas sp. OOF1S-7]|uniref:RHS repeat domain-containing protein n=1 Tax=Pseudoalteromonas sp. OOF1S-7 TaxID=2917757 RepID=UPI001EF71555|nr:hypothetical protein [Pseudoalteromonas sp. OOF1S-7]MCG7537560.1 hypothetical protein [Pseudoalteromonas sp. OOF1S-7]
MMDSVFRRFAIACLCSGFSASAVSGLPDGGGGGDGGYSRVSGHNNDIILSKMITDFELTPLTKDAFGDKISMESGLVKFSYKDVAIPLNANLDLAIYRSLKTGSIVEISGSDPEFSNWQLDLPRISLNVIHQSGQTGDFTHGWWTDQECHRLRDGQGAMDIDEYWKGAILHVPEKVHERMLYNSTGVGGRLITKSSWSIDCYTRSDGQGEGFKATSPDGITYYFDVKRTSQSGVYDTAWRRTPHVGTMYVSRIEDRFGNYLTYNYSGTKRLTSIYSNEGAAIKLTYNSTGKHIQHIKTYTRNSGNDSFTGKTWRYNYNSGAYKLESVTLPDGRSWRYQGFSAISYLPSFQVPETSCVVNLRDTSDFGQNYVWTVTHPNGATASYEFRGEIAGMSNQPSFENYDKAQRMNRDPAEKLHYHPRCYLIKRLKKKTISNLDKTYLWQYQYDEGLGGYAAPTNNINPVATAMHGTVPTAYVDAVNYRRVTVIRPDRSKTVSYVNRDYTSIAQGKVVYSTDYAADGTRLSSTHLNYQKYGQRIGSDFTRRGNPNDPYRIDLTKVTHRNYLQDGIDVFYTEYSQHDLFGNPGKIKEYSNFSAKSRYSKFTYYNDYQHWLIGLPRTKQLSEDGVNWSASVEESIYYSASGTYKSALYQSRQMGRVVKRISQYHNSGKPKRIEYEGTARYELFEDYYRGHARKVTVPCFTSNHCSTANGSSTSTMSAKLEVNSDGSIKSVTDFKGNKVSYAYNQTGWLTQVNYADPRWTDTHISYSKVNRYGDGIPGSGVRTGQLKQVVSTGDYQSTLYYDAMLRKTLKMQQDTTDTATNVFSRYEFDFANKPVLQSFPAASASNNDGIETHYDALGRLTSLIRSHDGAITTFEYLQGNKTRVTDPNGNRTTTTYLAYGQPDYMQAVRIQAENSSDVVISYNIYGNITSIKQGNVTEKRLYDGYQQLCKIYRPETGVSVFSFNAQRQLLWRADGTTGGTSSCNSTAVPNSHKVHYSYDNLGQLKSVNYPDNTPDLAYEYDENGNLTSLISASVTWEYLYNSRNLLEKEVLSLDNKRFELDWGYDSLANIASLTYPTGKTITFLPNALGQPTKAVFGNTAYVSQAKYHPNGQVKQFTYGNGIVRKTTQDSIGRTDSLTDRASVTLLSLNPAYDRNDNLSQLLDGVNPDNDITALRYDGADRLLSGQGPWGNSAYQYDGLGNITRNSAGTNTLSYRYDSTNRLSSVSGANNYGFQYDSRGNVVNNGQYSLLFNRANQLTSANGARFLYDGNGRRVRKETQGTASYSVYSKGGMLLYRLSENGDRTESIYLGDQLVAEVESR